MLSIIYSDWYYGVGKLYKSDGTPYRTEHGAFRNHPCTQWAAANQYNLAWLIVHGLALCDEYTNRYGKVHTCEPVIQQANSIYNDIFDEPSTCFHKVTEFTRAMPESLKYDFTITTITAYQRYLNTKPWLATNYLRIPSRKPSFIKTTMTTSLPVYDFSSTPEDRATKAKQGLVPAKKPAAKRSGKAGRIVGISADENAYIQEVLIMIADDPELGSSNANYIKIQGRYNK
jgi:hypothetical protein